MWETSRYAFKLPVKNQTSEAVHVANVVGSCSCIHIEPRTLDLAPGEVRDIDLTVDLTRAALKDDGTDARPFEAELYPLLESGGLAGESWPIKATVRSPFRVAPAYIDFGEVMRGDKPSTATLRVHCPPEVRGLAGRPEGRLGGRAADVFARCTVRVHRGGHAERHPGGRWLNTSVVMSAEVPGQGKVTKEVPVVGRLLDDVYCVPDFLSFGAVPVGQTSEDMVLLRSRSGRKFEIVGIDLDEASDITAAPAASSPGSPQFRVAEVFRRGLANRPSPVHRPPRRAQRTRHDHAAGGPTRHPKNLMSAAPAPLKN